MTDPGACGEWLDAILRSVPAGIHAVDPSGVTIFYNEAAARLDGLGVQEVVGRHVLEVFPSLTPETSTLLRVLRTRETLTHERQSYRNFRGEEVFTANTTRPVVKGSRLLGAVETAVDITEVKHLAERVVDLQAARHPRAAGGSLTRDGQGAVWTLDSIVTQDPEMLAMIGQARRIARTSSPVLVYGETGTGKELLVHGIHTESPRRRGPFVPQNCAALPAGLLEGILFGTVRGSFTGAENRPGLFELANGGTLFLDELNSLAPELQAKLLRVLEEGRVRRLGDTKLIPVDVRVIAAMNRPPEEAMESGALRPDLYYRIRVVSLELPPLRRRPGDIPLLGDHFVKQFNQRFELNVRGFSEEAAEALKRAPWPGNVRELKHAVEAAMNMADGERIELKHLPASLARHLPVLAPPEPLRQRMRAFEFRCLEDAMQQAGGNVAKAARLLGIPRQTLQSKLGRFHD